MTKFLGEKIQMRIHIGENDKCGHKPQYEALVDLLIHLTQFIKMEISV